MPGKWKSKIFMPFQVFRDPYELCKSTAPIISRYSRNLGMGQCKFIVSVNSYRTALWVFLRPTRIRTVKGLWDGAYGFSSSSEKTRTSNHFRRPNKGSTLYSVILRLTSSFDPAGVRARDPLRGFVWLLTDWRIVSVADRALKKTRRKLKGSIAQNGPNLEVLKQQRNEGR